VANTIRVRDLLHRVSMQLSDNAPQFKRWKEVELVHWLNDGQRVIAKYLPSAFSRVASIRLAPGSAQSIALVEAARVKPISGPGVDLQGRVLVDVHANMGADGTTPGGSIKQLPRDSMDRHIPRWRAAAPTGAIEIFTYDARTPQVFHVYPQANATTWVELALLVNPADVPLPGSPGAYGSEGASAVVLSVDDMNSDDLANYILARAQMKEAEVAGNRELAAMYAQMFVSSINAQAKALTGSDPKLRTLPVPGQGGEA
jgi:hypothetical protein